MKRFELSAPSGSETSENGNPFSFGTQWQYKRYTDLLAQEQIATTGVVGGFTSDQLRQFVKAYGYCPPGQQGQCQSLKTSVGYDTPIINPAPGVDPSADLNTVKLNSGTSTLNSASKTPLKYTGNKYISKYGNNSDYSRPEMAGYSFMPSNFKKSRTVSDPSIYGFSNGSETGITNSKYISTTHQRVTGGEILPLPNQLTTVNRQIRTLKNISLGDDPQSETIRNLNNLDQATRSTTAPPAVSTNININGVTFRNTDGVNSRNNRPGSTNRTAGYNTDSQTYINNGTNTPGSVSSTTNTNNTTGTNGSNTSTGTTTNNNSTAGTGTSPNNPYGQVPATTPQSGTGASSSTGTPTEYASFDNENIRFNSQPVVEITPLVQDTAGNFVPAGPPASARLSSPTPEVTIKQADVLGIPENSEIYINGKKIIIRGPDLGDIKSQVNCGKMGVNAVLENSKGTPGDSELTLVSCSGDPFTVTNGCGGGKYQQVGDFHVNRGFEQQRNVSVNANAQVIPASSTSYYDTRGVFRANEWGFTEANGEPKDLDAKNPNAVGPRYTKLFTVPEGLRKGIPTFMDTKTETTVYSTGGSNYRVGDRLRLVGGTPVNNTLGPLTKICIDSAGSGYKNAANLQVIINPDGQATGIGAAGAVTQLDENGGIAEITMLNYGTGYDSTKVPVIEIYDATPADVSYTAVEAAWPAEDNGSAITISTNKYVSFKAEQKLRDTVYGKVTGIEIQNRYMLATAPVDLGGVNMFRTVADGKHDASGDAVSISYLSDTSGFQGSKHPNRMQLQIPADNNLTTVESSGKGVRPNSYVAVTHFPASQVSTLLTVDSVIESGGPVYTIDAGAVLVAGWDEFEQEYVTDGLFSSSAMVTIYNAGTLVGHAYTVSTSGANLVISDIYDTDGNRIANDASNTLFAVDDSINIGFPKISKFWVPEPTRDTSTGWTETISSDNDWIVIEDSSFIDAGTVSQFFPADAPIIINNILPWWSTFTDTDARPRLVDSTDPRTPKKAARLTAKVGINPDPDADLQDPASAFLVTDSGKNYATMAGPLRVAKFLVTNVDDNGGITQLRVIDRGLYKIFPSDLTYGIPLEYDYVSSAVMGDAGNGNAGISTDPSSARGQLMGVVDPSRNNAAYGTADHPEYVGAPFGGNYKHSDWSAYPEYYWDGSTFQPFTGSPGAYDPSTYVVVDSRYWNLPPEVAYNRGKLLKKDLAIDLNKNSLDAEYGFHDGSLIDATEVAGGSGARVFLTAQDVPACTEKGSAKESLNIPDEVTELNTPKSLARSLNNALRGAGYDPTDIKFDIEDYGNIGVLDLSTNYPGVNIDSPTPGILEPLGLPRGDYNLGMLCIEATIEEPADRKLTTREVNDTISALYASSDNLGIITQAELEASSNTTLAEPTSFISMLCVDRIGEDGLGFSPVDPTNAGWGGGNPLPPGGNTRTLDGSNGAPGGAGDGGNEFPGTVGGAGGSGNGSGAGGGVGGAGGPNGAAALYGTGNLPTPLNDSSSIFKGARSTSINELYRYDITNIYGDTVVLAGDSPKSSATVSVFESKRFNSINELGVDPAEILALEDKAWVDEHDANGWAYLENGEVVTQQEPLIDVNYISNAITYDVETGNKVADLSFWDPFKGVIPGFVQNDIHFVTDRDPVAYNNSRTSFGRSNIGKVWWDTSTVRYQWYEQGTAEYRQRNWGRSFPGSTITICEWIESKSLPQNWNGNGSPRWSDAFVTERHLDPVTGKYELYYYYWVQNRTILDDRAKRDLGRKWDTQTIARYISNPTGNGLNLISFVSDNSLLLSNPSQYISDDPTHLQVNFSRNLNPDGLDHTAWKLMREGDDSSDVPDHISDKLIDSLCGYNALFEAVPDPRLSYVEKYGIKFRPRQTMFRDLKAARRVMVSTVNNILAGLKLNTQYPEWDADLPETLVYTSYVNWFAERTVNPSTNQVVRYDSSYKPAYNVDSVRELYRLQNLPDGTVVQVNSTQNNNTELWIWVGTEDNFKQISIFNETVMFDSRIYTDDNTPLMAQELRLILTALRDRVFVGTEIWNTVFFTMLKHAYMEQQQLDWAFKTSYLYIEKQEDDLVQFVGFKPDNFDKVLSYMNEVKPYTAKIREYKDGKRTPIQYIGEGSFGDFDKPPYVDPETNSVRILDETIPADYAIMANNSAYSHYLSLPDTSYSPMRQNKVTLAFDRTNWRLTEPDWNKTTTPVNQSIANNIALLNSMTAAEVSNSESELYTDAVLLPEGINPVTGEAYAVGDVKAYGVRSIDRIFKFDTQVQATFIAEVNTYHSDDTASSNADIVENPSAILEMLNASALSRTLALVKEKVGGNFRGETLDAKKFQTIIDDVYYQSQILTEFGFDADPWDYAEVPNTLMQNVVYEAGFGYVNVDKTLPGQIGTSDISWDSTKELVNYEGVFNTETQGNVTLMRNDEIYSGFDGVTFQRTLYGEERPEEMAVFDPLESLILTVKTSPYPSGNTSANIAITGGQEVVHKQHLSLFGSTDYVSLTDDSSSTLLTETSSTTYVVQEYNDALGIITLDTVAGLSINTDLFDGNLEILYGKIIDVSTDNNTITVTDVMGEISIGDTLTSAKRFYTYSDELHVLARPGESVLNSFLPEVTTTTPGTIWVGNEKIQYGSRVFVPSENGQPGYHVLSLLTRGVAGTTMQDHTYKSAINRAEITDHFNQMSPDSNVWLVNDAVSLADYEAANTSVGDNIMRFLHGL